MYGQGACTGSAHHGGHVDRAESTWSAAPAHASDVVRRQDAIVNDGSEIWHKRWSWAEPHDMWPMWCGEELGTALRATRARAIDAPATIGRLRKKRYGTRRRDLKAQAADALGRQRDVSSYAGRHLPPVPPATLRGPHRFVSPPGKCMEANAVQRHTHDACHGWVEIQCVRTQHRLSRGGQPHRQGSAYIREGHSVGPIPSGQGGGPQPSRPRVTGIAGDSAAFSRQRD